MSEQSQSRSERATPCLEAFRAWWADNANKFSASGSVTAEQKAWCCFRDAWYAAEGATPRSERGSIAPFARRWIDAKVRVPGDNSPVLVYQGDASHTKRTASYFMREWSWTDIHYDHPCKPEAWMPIPPYESSERAEG